MQFKALQFVSGFFLAAGLLVANLMLDPYLPWLNRLPTYCKEKIQVWEKYGANSSFDWLHYPMNMNLNPLLILLKEVHGYYIFVCYFFSEIMLNVILSSSIYNIINVKKKFIWKESSLHRGKNIFIFITFAKVWYSKNCW